MAFKILQKKHLNNPYFVILIFQNWGYIHIDDTVETSQWIFKVFFKIWVFCWCSFIFWLMKWTPDWNFKTFRTVEPMPVFGISMEQLLFIMQLIPNHFPLWKNLWNTLVIKLDFHLNTVTKCWQNIHVMVSWGRCAERWAGP